jgi:hypothetical protein
MTAGRPGGPVPIGREQAPELPRKQLLPRGTLVSPSVDRLLPQAATIDGTVLQVGAQRCDLATARAVQVRTVTSAMSWTLRGTCDAMLLEAWQDRAGPPVSLVITLGGWSLFRPEHLRLLAGIIAGRTWPPGGTEEKARQAATFLAGTAERIDRDNQSRNWNFRAGPMADRRESPGKYL